MSRRKRAGTYKVPAYYHQSLPSDATCENCGQYRSCTTWYTEPDPETGYRGEIVLCDDCHEEE